MIYSLRASGTWACLVGIGLGSMVGHASLEQSQALRDRVKVEGIRAHQKKFQDIADSNRGTRVAGSTGYRDSVSYVAARMRAADYEVRLQDFPLTISTDNSAPELKIMGAVGRCFEASEDFATMTFENSSEVSAAVEAVDLVIPSPAPNSSSSGCEPEDFATFTAGHIALLQRGTCSFAVKIENAIAAGASGVVLFNEGNAERTEAIATRLNIQARIPILGASFAVGQDLSQGVLNGLTGITAYLKVDVQSELTQVQNVIAESRLGDDSRVVTVGAHLDSVRAGPGMNDNGSGSAAILEIAEQYARLAVTPRNKVRFIWFGAEEFGLVGSEYYVNSLSTQEKNRILAMLNFDMLGSPNYVRFVYDGDSSPLNPHGSAYIEKIFLDYFRDQGLASTPTEFNGRSDYGPFIEAGIPAGGLFSGAEGIKSARLAQIYGGKANAPFDPCYHRACDTFANTGENEASGLALKSLTELSLAAAHAFYLLSNTSDSIRLPAHLVTVLPKPDFSYKGHMPIK